MLSTSEPRAALCDRLPLHTRRLVLRRLEMSDLDAVAAMLADPLVMRHFPRTLTRRESEAWLLRNAERCRRDGTALFAVTLDDVWIGDCGLVLRRLDAVDVLELGYHFRRDAWGHGYATEAAAACVATAHADVPHVPVVALIRSANIASRRVAARLGFAVGGATLHAGVVHERWDAPAPAGASPTGRWHPKGTLQ